jgi:lycopene beta-cyclase
LDHLGIKVVDILEEEFCYIPMGGPLPAKDQRVVAFGGASAMVHPSTGYNLCRNLMGAGAVAKVIVEGLKDDDGTPNLDKVAAAAYHAMWSPSNIRQRNFAVFGGEFLMKQNVEGLRGFFDGFFRLPMEMWSGFLAGWPGLPNNDKHETWLARLVFGLTFVSKLPPKVALDMLFSIVTYSITEGIALPQAVTPFFGEPDSYLYVERPKNQGDVAAKNEARKMISESKIHNEIPVPFEDESVNSDASGTEEQDILVKV